MKWLFLALIVVPSLELALLFWASDAIGIFPTLALIIATGFIGAFLAKKQGMKAVRRAAAQPVGGGEQAAAAVHHGGAGTTAAAVLAGIPSVVVPFFADQFFWGRRVTELGVGATTPARDRITADVLTDALRAALSRAQPARALGDRVAAEDGPGAAVTVLERLVEPEPSNIAKP